MKCNIIYLYHKLLLMFSKTPISKTKWFKHILYEEAQWIIGNRPWKKSYCINKKEIIKND